MSKNIVITVSGKGGVGKTTFSAFLLQVLMKNNPDLDILVVDADPDSNLPDVLGIDITRSDTVGGAAFNLKKQIEKGTIPPGTTKKQILETDIFKILKEQDAFDLLIMGRTEGDGCYCFPNQLLTEIVDNLSKNYDITLMDMEAGLEHLSRRTARDVDIMFIITDPSQMGIKTAERIKELTKEVNISFKKMYIIGNRFSSEMVEKLEEASKKIGIELAGVIPQDQQVSEFNFLGKPITDLKDSEAYNAVEKIARKVGLVNHN
ncbi:MAG: AAA family ATPase [Candidatus Hodarchaeota archaeon]